MACLEMYNNSQPPPPPLPMSPRISFSNDFVESHNNNYSNSNKSEVLAPASTDFEFTITTNFKLLTTTTSSADELFFKGRLLPLPYKDNNNNNNNSGPQMQRTLKDQLLVNDNEGSESDVDFSLKPSKEISCNCNKWKGFLSLRKSHIGCKKPEKVDVSTFDSGTRFSFSLEDPNLANSPQEMLSIEGSNSSDIEMGI